MNDPFDCEEFHSLCMTYRNAPVPHAQEAYEALQAYCRSNIPKAFGTLLQDAWKHAKCPGCGGPLYDEKGSVGSLYGTLPDGSSWHSICWMRRPEFK